MECRAATIALRLHVGMVASMQATIPSPRATHLLFQFHLVGQAGVAELVSLTQGHQWGRIVTDVIEFCVFEDSYPSQIFSGRRLQDQCHEPEGHQRYGHRKWLTMRPGVTMFDVGGGDSEIVQNLVEICSKISPVLIVAANHCESVATKRQ